MTSSDAVQIVASVREAQQSWARMPISRRCMALGRLRRAVATNCESIAEVIARETAKPLLDALAGDVMVTLEMIRYCERNAAKILRPGHPGKPAFLFPGARFETRFEPHGVALIFAPSNYPFQLSVVPLITALAAGNAVVLKCSERAPKTATLIRELLAKAGLPAQLVHVLHDEPDALAALIDAGVDIIFFTGSSRHGHAIAKRAAKHLTPLILELGGKDASIVFADCNLERAIEGVTYGAFSNGGRVCVAIKRAYIEHSIYRKFVARLRERVERLNISLEIDADMLPLSENEAALLRADVEDAIACGATLLYPANQNQLGSGPVLLADVPANASVLAEESFGPILCLAPFRDEAHAIALANQTSFALCGSVWTADRQRACRVIAQLSSGSCAANDAIRVIANPYAPFGGNGFSGYGRYHGPDGLRAFCRTKTIMFANSRRKREINWFPFTARTRRQLARFIRLRHGRMGIKSYLARLFLAIAVCVLCGSAIQAKSINTTRISVNVALTSHARGELAYLVFDSASGFPGDSQKAVLRGFVPIPSGAPQLRFSLDLPPGTYAVSVYEDLNGDHKLERNLLGIPREPVGASNNPRPHMGSPRFSNCSFVVGSAAQTISISLVQAS